LRKTIVTFILALGLLVFGATAAGAAGIEPGTVPAPYDGCHGQTAAFHATGSDGLHDNGLAAAAEFFGAPNAGAVNAEIGVFCAGLE
jgi:hypothetical protein